MKKLFAALAALAVLAPAATAAASHYLKVSPTTVTRGNTVKVSGAVGSGCATGHNGDVATVYSRAFAGATKKEFAGVPAFFVSLPKNGKFSFTVRIKSSVKKGSYHIGGRCGGGNFGSATLKVTVPQGPGFY
jgi:hypothetical protein